MNVVISGYYGSGNGGDEAMLNSILNRLSESADKITVISVNPDDTRSRHKVDAIEHLNPLAVIKAIYNSDMLISGGGSLLQNVTSWRSIYYYLGVILIALLLNKKVMLFAQGIGPIQGNCSRLLTRLILNRVDLITVRDEGSLEELSQLKIDKPIIECTADSVLSLNPTSLDFGKSILNDNHKPLIGIAIRRWKNFDRFKFELAKAIDSVDANFVFIPMQVPSDVNAANEVAELTKKNCQVLSDKFSTDELLSIVGNLNLLIAVRLHALIFAGIMNIPMIGISYDPKINRFLNSIDEEAIGSIDDVNSDSIVNAINHKFESNNLNSTSFIKLKELSERNFKLAIDLLQRRQ